MTSIASHHSVERKVAAPSSPDRSSLVALQLLCSALLPAPDAETAETTLVEKNTFLEFKEARGLKRSNSSPDLTSSPSLTFHDDQSTDLGEDWSRTELSSAGSASDLSSPRPASVIAERPLDPPSPAKFDKRRRAPLAPLADKARVCSAYPPSFAAYGLSRDADEGASMRRLVQLAQDFPLVASAELVPKKRNVVKLRLVAGADTAAVLEGLRAAFGEAPFVCGAPRVGRKEALIKLRVFDLLPQGNPGDVCYNFARKGKCKWTMCEWLHPRTSAAVLCL